MTNSANVRWVESDKLSSKAVTVYYDGDNHTRKLKLWVRRNEGEFWVTLFLGEMTSGGRVIRWKNGEYMKESGRIAYKRSETTMLDTILEVAVLRATNGTL